MCNYNESLLRAKENLDQRLSLERRRREDGEKYADSYFSLHGKEIVTKVLNSLIEGVEDQYHCETYFEETYFMQNEEYFMQSDAYRDGFKEKMVELIYKNICELIPDFKEYLDVIINEHYDIDYNRIHIIVSLKF